MPSAPGSYAHEPRNRPMSSMRGGDGIRSIATLDYKSKEVTMGPEHCT